MSRRRATSPISLKLCMSMYFWLLKTNLKEFFVGRRYFGRHLEKTVKKCVSTHTLYNAKRGPFH